jgi:hypothetical protein
MTGLDTTVLYRRGNKIWKGYRQLTASVYILSSPCASPVTQNRGLHLVCDMKILVAPMHLFHRFVVTALIGQYE